VAAVEAGELTISKALRPVKKRKRVEALAAESTPAIDGSRLYSVILADPPWRYEHSETESRDIENHYPTMTPADLHALDVGALCTKDAVLFLWVTSPKVEEAIDLLRAWGFSYRTCAVWVKDKIGMGYYFRQQHELLFVAARGSPPTPDPADRVSSVISAARRDHSVKPDAVHEIIERAYPGLSKVELFQRRARPGWDGWGKEAPK